MHDVELIDVCKYYGDVTAVENINLQVESGEFLALLGPSGCGKTTTLKMLGGLEEASTGIVKLKDKVVNGIPPHKRDTATVFQTWALFPHKTIFDNIAFGLKMRGVAKSIINDKVSEYLELVRLLGYEDRMPAQLSGGQQQRVALARALIVEPAVLLLDEPLSNLDLALRHQMRIEIKEIINKVHVTTVFVTHDQTEALGMANRVAVMCKGQIDQVGTPADIYDNPQTEFVAGFIGQPNFFDGTVESIGEDKTKIASDYGFKLVCPNNPELQIGDRASLSVRVENIRICEENEEQDNCFWGTVYQTTYLGSHLQYHIHLGEGHNVTVEQTTSKQARYYELNEPIKIGWRAEDCMSFRR